MNELYGSDIEQPNVEPIIGVYGIFNTATDDRDIHAANNMIWLYRWNKDNADKAETVYTDKKLVTSKLFYKNYRTICWDQ